MFFIQKHQLKIKAMQSRIIFLSKSIEIKEVEDAVKAVKLAVCS